MDFLNDLYQFMMERKKFWLLPTIIVLLLFGAVIALTTGSALSPFIYALF